MPHDDTQQNFYYINRRVGSTNYKVKVYFSSTENETMEEKMRIRTAVSLHRS